MKRLFTLLLAAVMMISVTACGGTNGSNNANEEQNAPQITDALEILTTVWASYAEAEKFPAGGGDSENINWEGPAKFNPEAVEELDSSLGLPAELAGQIDDAASLMHAMMMNNFTAGAYHLKADASMDDFTATLKDSLLARHWLCGSPEKIVVITIGDYAVSAYGMTENIDTFRSKVTAAYPTAVVAYEENIPL